MYQVAENEGDSISVATRVIQGGDLGWLDHQDSIANDTPVSKYTTWCLGNNRKYIRQLYHVAGNERDPIKVVTLKSGSHRVFRVATSVCLTTQTPALTLA